MNAHSIVFDNPPQTKRVLLVALILAVCVAGTIFLDLLDATFHQTSFYFSESLAFSSFWLIFLPLLAIQFTFFSKLRSASMLIIGLLLPPVIHLFTYTALVWIISNLFFEHTFAYRQTLQYEVTTYSFVLLVIYTIPFLLYPYIQKKQEDKSIKDAVAPPTTSVEFITSFLVTEGTKRKKIPVSEIWYFTADSPYITIHQSEKSYLFNETLRSVSSKIDSNQFVRIHKSTIVNLTKVNFYQSRLNGDYDVTLFDNTVLRLSRNYAADFKQKFQGTHPDTTE
ncbi:MAG: LytTR family transcriptional regulator [Cyclobacteriaceae bacterium]|nr:LytTR family transcriptional regulator [Cyclobacteriaceae bacterium]